MRIVRWFVIIAAILAMAAAVAYCWLQVRCMWRDRYTTCHLLAALRPTQSRRSVQRQLAMASDLRSRGVISAEAFRKIAGSEEGERH